MARIKTILDQNLESSLINDVFDKLKDASEIPFLTDTSTINIQKYVDKTAKEEDIKELWKSLLIDAICFLKINDTREKYNKSSKSIFGAGESDILKQKTFIKKFSSNRKLSSYGIDDISKYFDDFIKFESVLYGNDEYYRDHVDHVIQVWAMGISLIKHCNIDLSDGVIHEKESYSFNSQVETQREEFFKDIKNEEDKKERIEKWKTIDKELYISTGEIYAMWTIIALCHDLGYPIEKSYKINEKLKNILKYFGNINIQEFSYNFNLLNNYLVEKFLNIISSKAKVKDKKNEDKYGITQLQSKYRDKIAKSIEDYKHGVFSALLIFKSLTYFLETDYTYPNQIISFEDLRQFYIRKEILRAISGHTCPKLYHLNLNTLSFMLILCDELQEWGRPRFEDLKTGCIDNKPDEIKIVTFSKDEIVALMGYKDCSDVDIEKLLSFSKDTTIQEKMNTKAFNKYEKQVIRKFQMFHNLLRSAKDDANRNFKFEFRIEFKSAQNKCITYRFKFDSNNDDAFEVLKTQIIDMKVPINDQEGTLIDYKEIRYLEIYQ